MTVGVALKWTQRRLDVDPLDGTARGDPLLSGMSDADAAALETALALGEAWGIPVTAACVGPPAAEALLRDALAVGASRAVRVEAGAEPRLPGSPSSLASTADGLVHALEGCAVTVFGDASVDGGTGAVPSLYAAATGAAQALGLVRVEPEPQAGSVLAERRLDGGARERLRVRAPAVLSAEAGAARLRRASLPAVLAARTAEVAVLATEEPPEPEPGTLRPYRPRARALPGPDPARPARERVGELLGLAAPPRERREIRADPPRAAAAILDQLRAWGYL